jgi:hypothetical protein
MQTAKIKHQLSNINFMSDSRDEVLTFTGGGWNTSFT